MEEKSNSMIKKPDMSKILANQVDELNSFVSKLEQTLNMKIKQFNLPDIIPKPCEQEQLIQCPINSTHFFPKTSYHQHMYTIHHQNLEYHEFESHLFFYEKSTNIHPHISTNDINIKEQNQENTNTDIYVLNTSDKKLIIDDETVDNFASIINPKDIVTLNDLISLPNSVLESQLQSWRLIPYTLQQIDIQLLNTEQIQLYIITLMERYCAVLDEDLIHFISSSLYMNKHITPDLLVHEFKDFFGSKTNAFVLSLWKYIIKLSVMKIKQIKDQENFNIINENEQLQKNTNESKDKTIISENLQQNTIPVVTDKTKEITQNQITNNQYENTNKSFVPTLNQRDFIRRRQKYRGKNSEINKKTYTELIREFIERKMILLSKTTEIHTIDMTKQELSSKRVIHEKDKYSNPIDAWYEMKRRFLQSQQNTNLSTVSNNNQNNNQKNIKEYNANKNRDSIHNKDSSLTNSPLYNDKHESTSHRTHSSHDYHKESHHSRHYNHHQTSHSRTR